MVLSLFPLPTISFLVAGFNLTLALSQSSFTFYRFFLIHPEASQLECGWRAYSSESKRNNREHKQLSVRKFD
jgi:hypothetical protein